MESHFKKVVPIITSADTSENEKDKAIKNFEAELPKLSAIYQKYAINIIFDIRNGILKVEKDKTLMQYIHEYIEKDLDKIISDEDDLFGLDKQLLKEIYCTSKNERELNEHNRFEKLKSGANLTKVITYFTDRDKEQYSIFTARIKLDKELKEFILGENLNKKD